MTEPIALGSRLGRLGVVLAAGAVTVSAATAMAWTSIGDDQPSEVVPAEIDGDHDAHGAMGRGQHQRLAPYNERYDAASPAERAEADELRADVGTAVAAYADVDATIESGYRPPRRQRGPITHYLNRELAQGAAVLDPAKPTGLVYLTVGGKEPVLLGAFFVAPAGKPAPMRAGDLVVWHSHSPDCPDFFATEAEPCLDARRMLHVWTFDQVTLPAGRRGNAPERTVRLVDPFGVPLRAAVEKVDG
jgi:hypothetical protein